MSGELVEAYAIIQHDWKFHVPQEVSEFAWTSARGYRSILSLLSGISINKTALNWREPSDSPFRSLFLDREISVASKSWIMYRVLDVPAVLRALTPDATGSFSIRVLDPHLPDNSGPWQVEFADGKVSVSVSEVADLEVDIWRFTQAFLGDPSLADLARNGLVTVRNDASLAAACALLTPLPVCCLDAF